LLVVVLVVETLAQTLHLVVVAVQGVFVLPLEHRAAAQVQNLNLD
jgi:hypothetical protein